MGSTNVVPATEKKNRARMVALATAQEVALPEGFLSEGCVAQNTELKREVWVCGCGKFAVGEIGGSELHTAYTKLNWRLRKVGKQRVARCGECNGVNAEKARVAAEKAAKKVATATPEVVETPEESAE